MRILLEPGGLSMRNMETNDWILLNNIIYKIHTMDDFDKMRYDLLSQLKMIVDYDSADFYLASREEGKMLCNPVTINCDVDLSVMYEDVDCSRGMISGGKMLIYRETDIISDETRVNTDYYKKVYKPNNWHYAMQFIVARQKKFLGLITFYRTIGKENFQHDDIFVLDVLKDHIAYSLERYEQNREKSSDKYSISEVAEKYELTRRENTVIRCLLKGQDNAAICEELVITPNTLKKHILNIYRKLGIRNRVQLFKMVRESE